MLVTAAYVLAQHPAGSLLIVETANHTSYARDVTDYSVLATKAGPTTEAPARNFQGSYPHRGRTYNGGDTDAFVAKVNAAGTPLVYAGYIGGSCDDIGFGIAVDGLGNAYV